MKDKIFPLTFFLLKLSGYWSPIFLKLYLRLCYQIFTIFSLLSILSLIILLLLNDLLSDKNFVLLVIENLYLLINFLNCISKGVNMLIKKKNLIGLIEMCVDEGWSVPQDDEELSILEKSKRAEKLTVQFCLILIGVNGISNMYNPIFSDNPERKLIIEAYSICDINKPLCFWFYYFYQSFSFAIVSLTHVGCDCLMYNFIDRICALLKIIEHRLGKLSQLDTMENCKKVNDYNLFEKLYLRKCIKDHQKIIVMINELNHIFYEPVFIQFLSSILVVCTNVYFLSKQKLLSPESIAIFFYFCCVLVQNFFYCWYGYKITTYCLEFVDGIAKVDWTMLQDKSKKILLFMMLYASKKVQLFNNALVNLSPESFINILKMSYSAFTVLERSN